MPPWPPPSRLPPCLPISSRARWLPLAKAACCPSRRTPPMRSLPGSNSSSSAAGSASGAATRLPSPACSAPTRWATPPCYSSEDRTARLMPLPMSAATAATRSFRADLRRRPARSPAPITRGRTSSTASSSVRPATAASATSIWPTSPCARSRWRSGTDGSSSISRVWPARWRSTWPAWRSGSLSTRLSGLSCRVAMSTSSKPIGRSSSRTTRSATTARRSTRSSAR